jgi:hypothetical protein
MPWPTEVVTKTCVAGNARSIDASFAGAASVIPSVSLGYEVLCYCCLLRRHGVIEAKLLTLRIIFTADPRFPLSRWSTSNKGQDVVSTVYHADSRRGAVDRRAK